MRRLETAFACLYLRRLESAVLKLLIQNADPMTPCTTGVTVHASHFENEDDFDEHAACRIVRGYLPRSCNVNRMKALYMIVTCKRALDM